MADWSQTWTYLDGDWHEGNVPIIGPRTHAFWLGSQRVRRRARLRGRDARPRPALRPRQRLGAHAWGSSRRSTWRR